MLDNDEDDGESDEEQCGGDESWGRDSVEKAKVVLGKLCESDIPGTPEPETASIYITTPLFT
jgi:hypothetical protein